MRGLRRNPTYLREERGVIWDVLLAPFVDFGFMRRALLGCIAVSVGATPVGVFLMLRHMSLTGDAMAHAIFQVRQRVIWFRVFRLA